MYKLPICPAIKLFVSAGVLFEGAFFPVSILKVYCDRSNLIDQTQINRKKITLYIKRSAHFLFLCNPPKSGASQVCITFLQVTQKNTN